MKNKVSGIYQIQSKIHPERIYIGSAVDIDKRWKEHICRLKRGVHHSHKLQRYYNKYQDVLEFSIIFVCLKTELIEYEQKFIDKLNPYFNECKVAGSTLGREVSDKTRMKMSIARKGKNTYWMNNRVVSDITRQKMRESHLGIKPWNTGITLSEEHCQKMSDAKLGKKRKPFTDLHRLNISLSKRHKDED